MKSQRDHQRYWQGVAFLLLHKIIMIYSFNEKVSDLCRHDSCGFMKGKQARIPCGGAVATRGQIWIIGGGWHQPTVTQTRLDIKQRETTHNCFK